MPKVSIIIATHSRPHLLPRAVKSAFESGEDVEVVVVDDASTDETAEVCRGLENIIYVRAERNQKTAGARNIGILNSTAPYITFLDDDDWRLPGSLDVQAKILEDNPEVGLVYGQFLISDQDGHLVGNSPLPEVCPQGDVFWQILERNFVGCLTAVFRKSCLSRVGLLDQTISGTDDLDLWVRIAELYPFAAAEMPVAVWRKPTAESQQGSSNLVGLLSQALRTFEGKWARLPRAVAEREEFEKRRELFINDMMNQMFFDAAHTGPLRESFNKFHLALSSHPGYLYRTYTYKVILRTLLDRISRRGVISDKSRVA